MRMPSFAGVKARASRALGLSDRDKADSEPEPKDAPKPQKQGERELLALVEERREEAIKHLDRHVADIAIGMAYESGDQWVEWRRDTDGRGRLIDTRNTGDMQWYREVNLMRPLILTNTARFTSGRPDVTLIPKTTAQLDHEAVEEARAVIDYYNEELDLRGKLRDAVYYAQVATTAYEWFWWDARKWAPVPGPSLLEPEMPEMGGDPMMGGMDPMTGMPVEPPAPEPGYTTAQIGDVCSKVIMGHNVLIDPRARGVHDARWVVVEEVMGIGEIEERFGVKVKSEQERRSVLDGVRETSVASRWFEPMLPDRSATVSTMYENPSKKFERGRTVRCVRGQVIAQELTLPCDDPQGEPGIIPLLSIGYQARLDSPYDRNLASDLARPQYDYNYFRSRWIGMLRKSAKIVQVREMGDSGGADQQESLEESPDTVTLWYRRGSAPPQFTNPPVPEAQLLQAMDSFQKELADIAGVHIVSSGEGDPNAKSGYAIRLLQDSDRTMHAPFVQRIERFVEDRARLILKMVTCYVQEPRCWGLDDTDNPQEANDRVSDLPALRSGGAVAVRVIEASATPRTPEALDEEILALFTQGVLGNPQDPAVQMSVLESLQSPAAGRVKEVLERKQAEAAAQAAQQQELMVQQQMAGIQAETDVLNQTADGMGGDGQGGPPGAAGGGGAPSGQPPMPPGMLPPDPRQQTAPPQLSDPLMAAVTGGMGAPLPDMTGQGPRNPAQLPPF